MRRVTQEEKEQAVAEQTQNSAPVNPPLPINTTTILVVLLLVASFLLGQLMTKVSYLEKGVKPAGATETVTPAQTAGAAGGAAPTSGAPIVANVDPGHLPVRGDDNAKVTIVEFADLRCPFCKQVFDEVEPQLQKDYIDTGKVKFYFRHWAFLGPASTVAANAAECANEQGKFWDFHDYMYKNQPDESDTTMYTSDKLSEIAGNLGMDAGQFKTCLDAKKYDNNVTTDYTDGQKAGVSATPTFYVNGTQLVGAQPYSAFKSAIDAALAK